MGSEAAGRRPDPRVPKPDRENDQEHGEREIRHATPAPDEHDEQEQAGGGDEREIENKEEELHQITLCSVTSAPRANRSNRSGVNTTTQTVADPATGASVRRSRTAVWSGKSPGVEFIWLIAGIVVAFLALDFIFHASGANNVGFASFVFAVGKALAAPFAGIFNTAYAARGNLIVWADVLAIVIYVLAAAVIVKVVTLMSARNATTTN